MLSSGRPPARPLHGAERRGPGGAADAFAGTVAAITDGMVTLDADAWYAGEPTDQVEVDAPAELMHALIGAVEFEEGERYLVAATDGSVTVCGFSGPATTWPLYTEAFGLTPPGRPHAPDGPAVAWLTGVPMTVHGLLLAAGAGSRMGRPKALVPATTASPGCRARRRAARRRLRP